MNEQKTGRGGVVERLQPGVGVVLRAVGVTAAVGAMRATRRQECVPAAPADPDVAYRDSLAVFESTHVDTKVRSLVPKAAARVYLATRDNPTGVTLFNTLFTELDADVDRLALAYAMVHLKDAGLIMECPDPDNAGGRGYRAGDLLLRAATDVDSGGLAEFHAAINDMLPEPASDNLCSLAGSLGLEHAVAA